MGLDMYLTKRTYIGAKYERINVKGKIELTRGEDDEPIKIDLRRVSYIEEDVMYWRKANAIHNWFVENIQDGEDNCQTYYVSKENLERLIKECEEDIKSIEAGELDDLNLTPVSGFFFGSTDIDEYYVSVLKNTVEVISELIKEIPDNNYWVDIEYRSSW